MIIFTTDTQPSSRRSRLIRPCYLTGVVWLILCVTCVRALAGSAVYISEIMYHPPEGNAEWIEWHNSMSVNVDLSGWIVEGGVDYVFPANTIIPARGFLLLSSDPVAMQLETGCVNVLGPWTGKLANEGEALRLVNTAGRIMDAISYSDRAPWPVGADGSGASLERRLQYSPSDDPETWCASKVIGGTPGFAEFASELVDVTLVSTGALCQVGVPINSFDFAFAYNGWNSITNRFKGASWQDMRTGVGYDIGGGVSFAPWIAPEGNLQSAMYGQKGSVFVRIPFVLDDPAAVLSLTLRMRWDDGFVAYINGTRVALDNAPGGPAQWDAASLVPRTEENNLAWTEFKLDLAAVTLKVGINILAFQGVNYTTTSSDFLLLPELVATCDAPALLGPLAFHELSASTDVVFRVELRNTGSVALNTSGFVLQATGLQGGTFVLPAGNLPAKGLLTLAETSLGFRPGANDKLFLYAPGKRTLLDAALVGTLPQARSPEHGTRFLVPSVPTFGAPNAFALHTNIVINEIMYHAHPLPGGNGLPPVDSDEEWVELLNCGTTAQDLSGWSLSGGLSYPFPPGFVLAPGAFIVVARDANDLRTKYPDRAGRILGNASGRLSNARDWIRLIDAAGNPADELRYVEGGSWPALADGCGPSLELRDPRADNANGGAWAASDETAKAEWQTITYRMTAGQSYGPTTWNELRLGMLAAGVMWVDDLHVVRDPDGARQEILQNGSFETTPASAAWRFLGNHRSSTVIMERGGNHVLRIVTDGCSDTRHNHLETTFINNTPLQAGQLYEVRFRARWLSGDNRLLTSAYYAQLAHTTELTVPTLCGSPGITNSRYVNNAGPTLHGLRHMPTVPAAGEPVRIAVNAEDPDGVGAVLLHVNYNGLPGSTIPMIPGANGRYTATLPGRPAGSIVQVWVSATDTPGAETLYPSGGSASRVLYQVDDGRRTLLTAQRLRLIMLDADRNFMLDTLNVMSNQRLGGTVIYNDRDVYYDVGVRLRGSGAGRARDGVDYQSYSIAFPEDQLFLGLHDSIGIDRSGRTPTVRGQDEMYIKHLFNRAGLPCLFDDLVYFMPPAAVHTGTALMIMGGYDGVFLDTQFPSDKDGSVFNLDITYDPITTIGGFPEGLKPPTPFNYPYLETDLTDLGTDKGQYRGPFEVVTGSRRDDYTGLINFCRTMALPTPELSAAIDEVMDIDEWMRYAALSSLCGIGDTYINGDLKHNIRLYVPTDGRKITALAHDMDFVFFIAYNSPLLMASGNMRRVIDMPANTRLFWGHVKHLAETVFNTSYMNTWLAHYGAVAGQNFSGQSWYIAARSTYALTALPAQVPFAVTTSSFTVPGLTALIEGTGWIDIREFRIAGREGPLKTVWTSTSTWRIEIPVLPGANPLTLEVLGFNGEILFTRPFVITCTSAAPLPRDYLRVTEIHYHAVDSEDYEFIELQNTSTLPLALQGVRLTEAVEFEFGSRNLAPGGFIVVVEDLTAFSNRYQNAASIYGRPSIEVAGKWSGALKDSGETLRVLDATGEVVEEITYSDKGDWPRLADGRGPSLQRARAEMPSSTPEHWRASTLYHGSPGRDDAPSPVVINELMSHSDTGIDWIELFNTGTQSVDMGGWFLSDNLNDPFKYAIASPSLLSPGGYAVFDQNAFGVGATAFAFSELGEEAVVTEAVGTNLIRIIAYEAFDAAARDVPFGRWVRSDGSTVFTALAAATPGGGNAAPVVGPIVICEIMYHPLTGQLEYLELLNITAAAVPLYDPNHPANSWKLTSAVDYTFPPGTALPAGGRLIVAPSDADTFGGIYGMPPSVPVYGPWVGALDNAGESVRLRRPGSPEPDGTVPYITIDRVDYRPYAPWPVGANGEGPSLERLNCRAFGNDWRNWWAATGSNGTPGSLFDPIQLSIHNVGSLSWSAVYGNLYRVEYKDDLSDSTWNLLEERPATLQSETILDPGAAMRPRRFYRIQWLR